MTLLKTALANSANVENINGTGQFRGLKTGVSAYLTAQANTTVVTAGNYYPIQGTFSNSPLENFGAATVVTPGIKYLGSTTLWFEIDWHATLSGDANSITAECAIFKNGVLEAPSVISTFLKNVGQRYAFSGTSVVELATDDEIQLVTTSDTNGDVLTFYHFTTTIKRFFN